MGGRILSGKVARGASLPEIGKIKIGEKRKNQRGVEYPVSLDYFRATGNFANEFYRIFGDKPKQLHVSFISNNIEEVCDERFESWQKGKRYGYGNGQIFTVWDAQKQEYVDGVAASDPRVRALPWERTLTLRFVLLKMKGIMGYWSFQTKAKSVTIPSIISAFDTIMERAGSVIGFPFSLIIEKRQGYSPAGARTYPVVSLVPNFSQESIDHVRQYIQAGGNFNLLTAQMIQSGAVMQEAQRLAEQNNPQLGDGDGFQDAVEVKGGGDE